MSGGWAGDQPAPNPLISFDFSQSGCKVAFRQRREGSPHNPLIMRPNFLGGGRGTNLELTGKTITLCAIASAAKALQIVRRGFTALRFRHNVITLKREGVVYRSAEPASAANVVVARLDKRGDFCGDCFFLGHGWNPFPLPIH